MDAASEVDVCKPPSRDRSAAAPGDVGGAARVVLQDDHPGFSDADYRRRRDEIAVLAEEYTPGTAIPAVGYTREEHDLWALVARELRAKHDRVACHEYVHAYDRLALPSDMVPQLRDVTGRLQWLTGFRLEPVPGLVPTRDFYGALAERRFLSTQYIRHHSVPFYTPEPDLVHELVGHAVMLASPWFAAIHHAAGRASRRTTTDEALDTFSRIFWFTLEFGVVRERDEWRAYGAGLLSSFGELAAFHEAEIRPFDFRAMARQEYDITQYQPVLFGAPSFATLTGELFSLFEAFDDDLAHALRHG